MPRHTRDEAPKPSRLRPHLAAALPVAGVLAVVITAASAGVFDGHLPAAAAQPDMWATSSVATTPPAPTPAPAPPPASPTTPPPVHVTVSPPTARVHVGKQVLDCTLTRSSDVYVCPTATTSPTPTATGS